MKFVGESSEQLNQLSPPAKTNAAGDEKRGEEKRAHLPPRLEIPTAVMVAGND